MCCCGRLPPAVPEHAAVEHAARLSRLKVRLLTAADLGTTVEALCTGRHTGGEAAPPRMYRSARP